MLDMVNDKGTNKYKVDIKTLIINTVLTTIVLYLIVGTAFVGGLSSLSITDILFEVVIDLFIELIVFKDILYLQLLIICLIIAIVINIINEVRNAIKHNKNHILKE